MINDCHQDEDSRWTRFRFSQIRKGTLMIPGKREIVTALWTMFGLVLANTLTSHAEEPLKRTVHSQPSLILATSQVELAITELGGMLAPVTFYRDSIDPIQPYHISPWQDEPAKPMPAPVLVPLRGDFFCLPFGGNQASVAGEKHVPHGETASSIWQGGTVKNRGPVHTLTMTLDTKVRKGHITKEVSLVDGQNVVYSRHVIEGFDGPTPLGHHATLAMPNKEASVRIASSPIRFGMTYPGLFSDPKQGEYQSLLPGAQWSQLSQVPVAWKGEPDADLTHLPARAGHADLVQIFNVPSEKSGSPAWVTATFTDQGYLWFAFKDPTVLNSTVFWIENRGRHGHPWNGRNNCLGLEDVTAFFADGLAASIGENLLNRQGIKTSVELRSNHPTAINYIEGVVKVPAGFNDVKEIEFIPGHATFVSENGVKVQQAVSHDFVKTGQLP